MRIADVRKLLDRLCAKAGGKRAFAQAHDLDETYVSQVIRGLRPPSDRICKALGIRSDGERWVKR